MSPDESDEERAPAQSELGSQAIGSPLLASEALKDELAPVEPLRHAARIWCLAAAAWFAALGFAPQWGHYKPGPELGSAAACLLCAALPIGYARRAAAMLLVGAVVGVAGMLRFGPAQVMAYGAQEWSLLHLLAAIALPAALLFRSRYRAYPGARAMLAAALALALPLAGYCALQLERDAVAVQVASGATIVALAGSLVGFMGSQAAIGGNWLAGAILLAVVAQAAAEGGAHLHLSRPDEWGSMLASAAAFGIAAGLGAIGLFQLLAARSWARAREVDVRPSTTEPPAAPPSAPSLDSWTR